MVIVSEACGAVPSDGVARWRVESENVHEVAN